MICDDISEISYYSLELDIVGSSGAVGNALYAIGGKWRLRIIIALTDGNKRFNELKRLADVISAQGLAAELKELKLNSFVKRNVFTGTQAVVETR